MKQSLPDYNLKRNSQVSENNRPTENLIQNIFLTRLSIRITPLLNTINPECPFTTVDFPTHVEPSWQYIFPASAIVSNGSISKESLCIRDAYKKDENFRVYQYSLY